ncbi:CD81 antigen-like isoform X1 [Branchiostoma floridae x Branchiostoma japonicum]
MAEGSRANVKTQLFVFNVVLWLAGGILFAVGLWLLYDPEITKVVSAELKLTWFYHACYAMVVAGAATLVVGCVGCYGAMKERKSLLMLFAILLFILFVLNMAAFIVGIMYRNKAYLYTYDSFADALPRGYIEEQDYEFKEAVKKIESKFSCCGLREQPFQHGAPCLQDTCLCDPNVGEDCKDYSVFGSSCTVYAEPCLYKVISFLRQKMIAVIVMPLIVALIQLFGIWFVWRTQRNVGENVA